MTFIKTESPGMLDMKGKKTFLGVPKNTMSGKSDMGSLDKAIKRGEDVRIIKK